MSICIYPLRPEQRLRLGARTALQPLGPFPGRTYHRAPWDLNRAPLDFPSSPRFPTRLANIHVGQDATAPPAADAPERVTYTLQLDLSMADGQTKAITSPTLPAPCTIDDVTVTSDYFVSHNLVEWQLLLLDNPINGNIPRTLGERLIIPRRYTDLINFPAGSAPYGVIYQGHPAGGTQHPNNYFKIGRLVTQPGLYLAFAVATTAGNINRLLNATVSVIRHQRIGP